MNGALQETKMSSLISIHLCWLCGEAVDLRTCKIDEYGETVHEACYTVRLALESGTRKAIPEPSKVDIHIPITRL
jgi:hypothetical protein